MSESVIQLPTDGETVIETYERIARRGAMVPVELTGGVAAWSAASYQAVSEVLAGDGTLFSKSAKNCPALHNGTIPADWPMRALTDIDHMLNKDGEDHRRLRKTISAAFTPARWPDSSLGFITHSPETLAEQVIEHLRAVGKLQPPTAR
ncbi:hypothetical protein [Nocardia pseudovaccinii]|uniref:hypothetical protein n=1 Tax=Nocardia pseudovaccinii TaxID=189540 RepID=UPI0007A453D6|nr:hypothetical protein [Nocardia pseudovaccinii]